MVISEYLFVSSLVVIASAFCVTPWVSELQLFMHHKHISGSSRIKYNLISLNPGLSSEVLIVWVKIDCISPKVML